MSTTTKGPGLFSNFGKHARDLLYQDYLSDQKFTVSSTTESGLAITSNVVKKDGTSFGDVAGHYKFKNAAVHVKVDPECNVLTTLNFTDLPLSTKAIASINLPDPTSGKLELQHFSDNASMSTAVGLNKSPDVDCSLTLGTPSVAFGAEAAIKAESQQFTKYDVGLTLTRPKSTVSVILADKADSIRFSSYLREVKCLNGGAAAAEINRKFSTNENTLTVGCSYVVDPHTLLKAKLNNHGNLGAVLQHELQSNSVLTLSSSVDTQNLNRTPKFGMSLSLKS